MKRPVIKICHLKNHKPKAKFCFLAQKVFLLHETWNLKQNINNLLSETERRKKSILHCF